MKTAPTLTSCCSVTAYLDPISFVGMTPSKIRIGGAVRCSSCHRIFGDIRMDKFPSKDVASLQAKANGTSWAMLCDASIKHRGEPTSLNLEIRNGFAVPENYKGALKQQPELAAPVDEDPF